MRRALKQLTIANHPCAVNALMALTEFHNHALDMVQKIERRKLPSNRFRMTERELARLEGLRRTLDATIQTSMTDLFWALAIIGDDWKGCADLLTHANELYQRFGTALN